MIAAEPVEDDVHPSALVTVKVNELFSGNPANVPVVPLEVKVNPLGSVVKVQSPVAGKLLNSTEPVATAHVG